MSFQFENSGIAASVYLAFYTIYLLLTINILVEKGFKTVYTSLFIFGVFRVCGQLCGVAFAKLGYSHYQWLIAYLVFSAEGYFTLILTSFHLIAQAQVSTFGQSWIRPTKKQRKRITAANPMQRIKSRVSVTTIFHGLLIPANAFIIAGGSMLTGQSPLHMDPSVVSTSKGLRTTGQIIFLLQTIISISLAGYVYIVEKIHHSNIYCIFLISPFLLIRGIFGILSIYLRKMNYYDMSNYNEDGMNSSFVVYEYVLATTMEFIVGIIYISNYYYNRRDITDGSIEDNSSLNETVEDVKMTKSTENLEKSQV